MKSKFNREETDGKRKAVRLPLLFYAKYLNLDLQHKRTDTQEKYHAFILFILFILAILIQTGVERMARGKAVRLPMLFYAKYLNLDLQHKRKDTQDKYHAIILVILSSWQS